MLLLNMWKQSHQDVWMYQPFLFELYQDNFKINPGTIII